MTLDRHELDITAEKVAALETRVTDLQARLNRVEQDFSTLLRETARLARVVLELTP